MHYTNRGIYRRNNAFWRAQNQPTVFYLHLIVNPMPTRATNTLSELSQIANGNGYSTDGISLTRNTTDFAELVEDDAENYTTLRIKNIVLTASGGTIPTDMNGARGIVICDDNATVGSRDVLGWWEFSGPVVVSDTQTLTIQQLRLRDHSVEP